MVSLQNFIELLQATLQVIQALVLLLCCSLCIQYLLCYLVPKTALVSAVAACLISEWLSVFFAFIIGSLSRPRRDSGISSAWYYLTKDGWDRGRPGVTNNVFQVCSGCWHLLSSSARNTCSVVWEKAFHGKQSAWVINLTWSPWELSVHIVLWIHIRNRFWGKALSSVLKGEEQDLGILVSSTPCLQTKMVMVSSLMV